VNKISKVLTVKESLNFRKYCRIIQNENRTDYKNWLNLDMEHYTPLY